MNEDQAKLAQIERHPDSPMIVVVAENGARGLLLCEEDGRAIAAAGPGRDTWSPTWFAFDIAGPRLDFHGVPATLEAAVEARKKMREHEPVDHLITHPRERDPIWWKVNGELAGLPDLRFRGAAQGGPPCLCAQLLDRGDNKPFPASCLRDGSSRLVAERGCRIIASRRPEIGRRGAARTARAIERVVDQAPHPLTLFRQATIEDGVWKAMRRDVRAKLKASAAPQEEP